MLITNLGKKKNLLRLHFTFLSRHRHPSDKSGRLIWTIFVVVVDVLVWVVLSRLRKRNKEHNIRKAVILQRVTALCCYGCMDDHRNGWKYTMTWLCHQRSAVRQSCDHQTNFSDLEVKCCRHHVESPHHNCSSCATINLLRNSLWHCRQTNTQTITVFSNQLRRYVASSRRTWSAACLQVALWSLGIVIVA